LAGKMLRPENEDDEDDQDHHQTTTAKVEPQGRQQPKALDQESAQKIEEKVRQHCQKKAAATVVVNPGK
jgi:hypothetical protein